ncbi:MAG: type III-A CRISPR-associated RAMP protein Csm5 [Aquificaceae bacterium]|nr:type III-A CRISPR-associated RAMP protein Csm5 [Aquificaceae bacterium]MDW8423978.1 type III-A CRISPR-associated RAMP protein Csm5 [Aquificaceae bacterium]
MDTAFRSLREVKVATIRVLSPVHVGDGEKLTSLDYIYEGNRLCVYTFQSLLKAIEKSPKKNDLYKLLKVEVLRENASLKSVCENLQLKPEPLYSLEVRGQLRTSQVETFIKNLHGPYLPGSEIKGALRLLFLCGVLDKESDLLEEFIKEAKAKIQEIGKLSNDKEKHKLFLKLQDWLESKVFYPEGIDRKRDLQGQAQNYDLFRCLEVSDSQPIGYENLVVECPQMVGSDEPLNPCEALKEGTEVKVTISINTSLLQELEKLSKAFKIPYRYAKYMKLEHFKEFSKAFNSKLIDMEAEFFKRKGRQDIAKHLESIKAQVDKGILLRLGKHEGYLSTTIMAIIKKRNKELFDKIFMESQPTPRQETNKTRRINSQGKTFGWVLLEV